MPKREPDRDPFADAAAEIARRTASIGKDAFIGAAVAKTAPWWAPFAASAAFWLGVVCLVLSLMCGGASGLVTLILTDSLNTASLVGLIGFGVGFVSLPMMMFLVYRRVRRHRLMQAVNPHIDHVTKHARKHFWATMLGMFSK